jgi:hypothetical protein
MKDDVVGDLRKGLSAALGAHLMAQTNSARRLYLLHDRLEPVEDGKKWQQILSLLHHYLQVGNPGHRKALTKLLVADHNYGDEALGRQAPPIPLAERHCCLCRLDVETPAHVWLGCSNRLLVTMRREFVTQLLQVYREVTTCKGS